MTTQFSKSGCRPVSTPDFDVVYTDHQLDYVTYAGMTVNHAHDTVDQLTTVDYTGSGTPADESYSYDDAGNRTNTGYTTGDHNRLTCYVPNFDRTFCRIMVVEILGVRTGFCRIVENFGEDGAEGPRSDRWSAISAVCDVAPIVSDDRCEKPATGMGTTEWAR